MMSKINPPKMFLVRTKCDFFDSDVDFEEVVAQDRDYLSSIGVHREVLYISVKRPDDFKDNLQFKNLLLGKE